MNGLREIQLFAKYYICNYVIARVYAKSYIKIFLFTFKLQDYLSLYKLRYSNVTNELQIWRGK